MAPACRIPRGVSIITQIPIRARSVSVPSRCASTCKSSGTDTFGTSTACAPAVSAARSYGLEILDGVYNDIGDTEGFERECMEARDLGFDGKTLIHPSQIEPCNRIFSPTPAELDEARKILAAFALPENHGKGVIKVDGRMVERLHAEMARRVVAVAEAGLKDV